MDEVDDVLDRPDSESQNGPAKKPSKESLNPSEMVEITPPELISALITENGVMTPNAVSEELIKLWF